MMLPLQIFTIPGIFLAMICLSACHSYPMRVRYRNLPPDMKIIRGTPEQVDAHCKKYATRWDDGTRVNKADQRRKIKCCAFPGKHLIFVSADGDDCIYHEMMHIDRPGDSKWVEDHVPGNLP